MTTQFTATPDLTGVERSAIYRINPDNTVETLWSSKEENVYDLLALPNQLLFSTDTNGRIYGLSHDRKITLVLQTNEGEATRLLPSSGSVLVATGDMGRIYRLGEVPGAAGSYESPVHDAGTASRWGSLSWRAEMAPATALVFRTRSGNSAKPDKTWSDWSEPLHDAAASAIASPNARYIQWKAEFSGTGGVTPILDNVTLAYLPQNSPPIVHSINVTLQMAPASGSQGGSAAGHFALYRDGHRYRRCQRFRRRRHAHADAFARRRATDHHQLAGRRSRWRPPGLQPLFPRRRRAPLDAAEGRPARQRFHLR